MLLSRALLLLPFTLLSCVQAQDKSAAALQHAIQSLPKCAVCCDTTYMSTYTDYVKVQCLMVSVKQSSCQLSDFKCIAQDKALNAQIEKCVQQDCTIREALSTFCFALKSRLSQH